MKIVQKITLSAVAVLFALLTSGCANAQEVVPPAVSAPVVDEPFELKPLPPEGQVVIGNTLKNVYGTDSQTKYITGSFEEENSKNYSFSNKYSDHGKTVMYGTFAVTSYQDSVLGSSLYDNPRSKITEFYKVADFRGMDAVVTTKELDWVVADKVVAKIPAYTQLIGATYPDGNQGTTCGYMAISKASYDSEIAKIPFDALVAESVMPKIIHYTGSTFFLPGCFPTKHIDFNGVKVSASSMQMIDICKNKSPNVSTSVPIPKKQVAQKEVLVIQDTTAPAQ